MLTTGIPTHSALWIVDDTLKTLHASMNLCTVLGVDCESLRNRTLSDLFPIIEELIKSENTVYPVTINLEERKGKRHYIELIARYQSMGDAGMWILEFFDKHGMLELEHESSSSDTTLFEDSPIPIWDEDFSMIKQRLDELRAFGVISIRSFFQEHPEELLAISSLLRVNRINKAVVELNEASGKHEVLDGFRKLTTTESNEYIIVQLEAIWNNETCCEFDAKLITMKGNLRYVNFKWTVVPGSEKTYDRIYLTTTDLTKRIKEENLYLQQANKEKETLLREVHHRVKNNLQIITSLIRLQLGNTGNTPAKKLLEVSLSRISSIASVHELLYKSNQFSSIDYSEYIHHLVESLINSMADPGQIDVEIEVDDVKIPLDSAIPLGLLINEILTNSIKHAFQPGKRGKIHLKLLKEEDDRIVLKVGDNGNGFSLPSSTSDDEHETLGLSLIDNLAEQLSGTLTCSSHEGTQYVLAFKVNGKARASVQP